MSAGQIILTPLSLTTLPLQPPLCCWPAQAPVLPVASAGSPPDLPPSPAWVSQSPSSMSSPGSPAGGLPPGDTGCGWRHCWSPPLGWCVPGNLGEEPRVAAQHPTTPLQRVSTALAKASSRPTQPHPHWVAPCGPLYFYSLIKCCRWLITLQLLTWLIPIMILTGALIVPTSPMGKLRHRGVGGLLASDSQGPSILRLCCCWPFSAPCPSRAHVPHGICGLNHCPCCHLPATGRSLGRFSVGHTLAPREVSPSPPLQALDAPRHPGIHFRLRCPGCDSECPAHPLLQGQTCGPACGLPAIGWSRACPLEGQLLCPDAGS